MLRLPLKTGLRTAAPDPTWKESFSNFQARLLSTDEGAAKKAAGSAPRAAAGVLYSPFSV